MSFSRWGNTWYEIGIKNPWVRAAYDPPFKRNSIYPVETAEQLAEWVAETGWCIGAARWWDDQCWINQIEGGSEWMVIKQDVAFESMSGYLMGPTQILQAIRAIAGVDVESCRKLTYMKDAREKNVI